MFCPKCGKQLSDGFKFCTGCGARVEQPIQPQMQPRQQPIQQPQMQPVQQQPIQQPQIQSGQQSSVRQPMPSQNVSDMQGINLSAHIQKTQETKEMENKNKHIMIVLFVVLLILILAAVGMAIYYFSVLRNENRSVEEEKDAITETVDETEETDEPETEEADADTDNQEEMSEEEAAPVQEEEAKVTSDTNEVIKDTILYSIPKSVYSYDFDESLGNAQVVVRNDTETMPEIVNDVDPQYVAGMDGKAVYLDGSYGIRLSDVQRVGESYTIAFWMKADAIYDWAPFIHIGYNLLESDQRCRLWLGQKTDRTSVAPILSSEQARTHDSFEIRPTGGITSMNPGIWYYIVFTVNGNKQGSSSTSVRGRLYVAGQFVGEGNVALDEMNVDNLDVYLGINCWDKLYPIAFDDVKIWDQVLDDGQIADLFNAYQ